MLTVHFLFMPVMLRRSVLAIHLTDKIAPRKWEQISFKTRPVPYWAFGSIGKCTCFLDVGRDEVKLHNMLEAIKCVPVVPVL